MPANPYNSESFVKNYSQTTELQQAEKAILNETGDWLAGKRILDIGVGAGRTTRYFAPLASEYVGVDRAENMLRICRERFPESARTRFVCADMRDLRTFPDGYFDFVLISFNSIDSLSPADRLLCLGEVRRVCQLGGYLCFSSHNLQAVGNFFRMRQAATPLGFLKQLIRLALVVLVNLKALLTWGPDYAIFNDGVERFRVWNYYVSPRFQLEQLRRIGFGDVRLFGAQGEHGLAEVPALKDPSIYYLCRAGL